MTPKKILLRSGWGILFILGLATLVRAANTPIWWDNPKNLPFWTQTIATGTASNTGPQAQFIIAKIDVANTFRENYSKYVWVQVEWSLVEGTGEFVTGSYDHLIKWMNSDGDCPSNPELPFPDPADGAGFMKAEGVFTPEFDFQNGFELSFFKITPQPACERIEIRFNVGPNSHINYRVEIQTACLSFDFGDAPDPQFPTLLSHDGARHIIAEGCRLGALIDAETDGQPDAEAGGDDLNTDDDEDGVQFLNAGHLTQGGALSLLVTASRDGYLNGWADFNHNSSWADAGEQLFTDQALTPGVNSLTATLPNDAATGTTVLRFRFSTDQHLSCTGLAGDGEVEDYALTILPAEYDFGDAPDPTFPTLLSHDGARHRISELKLGHVIDAEQDGQPSADARGDDNQESNDEDGISFAAASLQQGGTGLIIANASGAGKLNAWIDFNGNGAWDDLGEQIFVDQPLSAGDNALSFSIPHDAQVANVSSRFRFNSIGGLTASGPAEDGEVEDYQITLLVPVELSAFTARQSSGAVTLEWTTQSETENLGFYVYRSEGSDAFQRINEALIPGAGTTAAARSYTYQDANVLAGKTYRYQLADLDHSGRLTFSEPVTITVLAPEQFALEQNYPNPFNPSTVIPFRIKQAGAVSLEIYNLKGQRVNTLINRILEAGAYTAVWDARDAKGRLLPSGSYLYKLKTGSFEQVKLMEYVK
ncbi:MAG TPA: GEVED domain-containing protein [bacterium]|nr:GEVED domain-containing protein [bacterium]HPN33730.1 GEVED domain-containing protein [bacterium]